MATKWRAFVVNTTVHGLRYVYESPSRVFRVLWLLLLLTAIVFHVFFTLQSFLKYHSNPISTEFTEVIPANGELVFPAVTICNLNRFVKRKINMPESEGDFSKLGLNLSACEAIKKVNKDMTCGQGLLCAFELFGSFVAENCNDTIKSRIISVLNNTKEPSFNPEEFLSAYGHDFRDMLLHYCRFAVVETCSSADFYPLLVQKGRCFTFNSGRNGTRIRRTRRTGSSGGLGVFLDTQVHENTIGEFSHGLRVIVHEQGTLVNFERGFDVFPGSHTLVRVTTTKVSLIRKHY